MIKRRIRNGVGRLFKGGRRSITVSPVSRPASAVRRRRAAKTGRVRYAVVGLGHISQVAVLPAFRNASKNSELAALVSGDAAKLRKLGRRFRVPILASYEEYDSLLRSGKVDAVYIAEPNSLHRDFTIRAAQAGVHVLCEKPLAVTEQDCEKMIAACRRNRVKLMTAYRLHFEKSNLEAIRLVQSGKLGEPRFFNSIFSMQATGGGIRLKKKMGGGPLYDLGVYCLNASRYLFRAEPVEVRAMTARNRDPRFREVEEMSGAVLRFPGDRLATFICSFGAADSSDYAVVGTKGVLKMKNAYEYVAPVEMELTMAGKTQKRRFEPRDQFGPEILYFSNCILKNKEPEPSGVEGLNDVRVIRALYQSAKTGSAVRLKAARKKPWPSSRQEIRRSRVRKPEPVRTESPSQ